MPLVALIGERHPSYPAHQGIEASLRPRADFRWLGTAGFQEEDLQGADAVWCVPGSPYASAAGALRAIRWARLRGTPFLGTCGGFQHALMEFAQNVLGRPAAHAEENPEAPDPLIARLACSLAGTTGRVIAADDAFAALLGAREITAEFNCQYGLRPLGEALFSGSDLQIAARDEHGAVRAFRLKSHPFFVGTLFQPERQILRTGTCHPLIGGFLQAAAR
ncbi:MAG TPA: hypothetical protein VFE31_16465 [Opitutaceae bacterium]|jgi:CTP synthase (UTP-ammonia lyase)|nr:hypothetical protein [Opitutaceae bacterium]